MTPSSAQTSFPDGFPLPPEGKTGWPWTYEVSSAPAGDWPSVSLVMPCRNAVRYIEGAIRSVLLQGYPHLEFFVVDGGSTDGTIDVIRRYAPWLTHWVSEPDRGQSHAINKGLAKATGRYFNWHNADDWLAPGSLFETVRGFQAYPDAQYICRHRLLLHDDNHAEAKPSNPAPGKVALERALIAACPGGQPGGLMRRESVVAVGGVDESFMCCMDEDLMMKLRLIGPGYYLDGPGVYFRVRSDQQSAVLLHERIAEKFRIIETCFRAPALAGREDLMWSARIFAAGHASGLCRKQGRVVKAFIWKWRSRLWRGMARCRRLPVQSL